MHKLRSRGVRMSGWLALTDLMAGELLEGVDEPCSGKQRQSGM